MKALTKTTSLVSSVALTLTAIRGTTITVYLATTSPLLKTVKPTVPAARPYTSTGTVSPAVTDATQPVATFGSVETTSRPERSKPVSFV